MNAFELTTLLAEHARAGQAYLECLRVPSLSVGLYRLPAGGVDPQSPHTEDEVYYVVSGKAQIRVGDEDRSVGPDSIVLVAARVPHRFHSIEEDLTILVFFAPAEYSDEQGAPRLARPRCVPASRAGCERSASGGRVFHTRKHPSTSFHSAHAVSQPLAGRRAWRDA